MTAGLAIMMLQTSEGATLLTLLNDNFLQWAFRGLLVAALGYLVREHGRQRRQDEAILKLQEAMRLNHPSRADFELFRVQQESLLKEMRQDMQTIDRIVRLLAAKQNIDVRV